MKIAFFSRPLISAFDWVIVFAIIHVNYNILPPMFLSCALQIGKNTVMIQEYPIAIDHITAVLILNNLQYSTKVVKFGILSQYRSLVWLAFSLWKEIWLIFEWNESELAKPHILIHIHNLIANILTSVVATPVCLVVSWRSPRPSILLNLYLKWLINK